MLIAIVMIISNNHSTHVHARPRFSVSQRIAAGGQNGGRARVVRRALWCAYVLLFVLPCLRVARRALCACVCARVIYFILSVPWHRIELLRTFSCCTCPDGNLFCSHMIAVLLLFSVIQSFPNLEFADFIGAMPEAVKAVHSTPIPWSYLFNYGMSGPAGFCKVKQAADHLEAQVVGEASDSDSDDAGNESGAVDIIQKAVDYISECIARASESTENSEKAERRVKRARITEYTNELIAFRSERDPYEKRRIDKLHESYHLEYEKGALGKSPALVLSLGNRS